MALFKLSLNPEPSMLFFCWQFFNSMVLLGQEDEKPLYHAYEVNGPGIPTGIDLEVALHFDDKPPVPGEITLICNGITKIVKNPFASSGIKDLNYKTLYEELLIKLEAAEKTRIEYLNIFENIVKMLAKGKSKEEVLSYLDKAIIS